MNVPGPLSVSTVSLPHQQELDLRPFQRVTAQVLSVTGTTALLTIEGYPVVAQLASADQAATLLPQQTARFIVTQRTSAKIMLKMISDDQLQVSLAPPVLHRSELAVRLLEQENIPVTAKALILARAVLKKNLPITAMLLNDLSETLSAYGSWGSREAELAIALKSVGLPLNVHSLALASRQRTEIGASLARLIAGLTDLAKEDLPEELLRQLFSSLEIVDSLVLKADAEASELAEQLKAAVHMLGRSLENTLLEQMQNPGAFSENNLVSLVRLQQALERAEKDELANVIRDFLRNLQRNQFWNTKPEPILGRGEWTEIGFAVQGTQQKESEPFSSARLRIARESDGRSSKINPAYTRLILQVDVAPEQTVEVDLAVADKQIRTSVTVPDTLCCRQAQEELPTLERALQNLGFTLRETQISVGEPQSFDRLTISGDSSLMRVDIEA